MKKIKYGWILGVAMLLATACADDNGNYDYSELNQLTISGIESNYTAEQFEPFQISTRIDGTLGYKENDYDYLWYIYVVNGLNSPDTLSYEKDLNVKLNMSPGEYDLVYTVTNKETGVFAQYRSEVLIVNSFSKGLAVLSNVNGDANIAFVNAVGSVTENAYQTVNGQTAGKNPKGIFFVGAGGSVQPMVVISTEEGSIATRPTDFSYMMDFKDMFYFPSSPGIVQAHCRSDWGYDEYLVVDGGIYNRKIGFAESLYPKFLVRVKGNYSMAPFSLYEGNDAYFYDETIGSFWYERYGLKQIASVSDGVFNPADMKAKMIWGRSFEMADGSAVRAVMQDENNLRFVISGKKANERDPNTYKKQYKVKPTSKIVLNHEGADKANCFTISSNEPDFLYYAYDNKIVCVSCITGNTLATYTVEGGNIDHMEFDYDESPNLLYVGVSNGSGAAKSGSVYYLERQSGGGLKKVAHYQNICGKVVDFQFKK